MSVDRNRAAGLAGEGFDLWQAGKLEDALVKYVAALDAADPNHVALPDYHGEIACVLATLGRDPEALEQFEISLMHELRRDPEGKDVGVTVARYCVCEQLLKMKQPERVLHVVAQGVERAGTNEWLLRVVEARASWDLGRRSEAKKSAALAVFKAPSEGKAKNLREYLAEILGSAVDTP